MNSRTNEKRLQFSLNSLLNIVTAICVTLATAAIFPRFVLPILPISAFVAVVVFVLIAVDRRLGRSLPTRPVPVGSFLLIAASAWSILFILTISLIRIPGGFGPIQYAIGNDFATFVFNLRFCTILLMVGSPILCAMIGMIRGSRFGMEATARFGWLVFGIASALISWVLLFVNPEFIPTA